MNPKTAALRSHIETVLAGRLTNPFTYQAPQTPETVPFGVPALDQLTGGLPRGCLTEVYGPPCSGRASVLNTVLASRTAALEVCALVDASDSFDPEFAEAAGVRLQHVLWVRCRNADQALRASDVLIQGSGFGLIVLDLSGIPSRVVRSIPLPVWFRFRRSVEYTPTALLVLAQESNAKSCASLVLRLERQEISWSQTAGSTESIAPPHTLGLLLDGWKGSAQIIRSRSGQPGHRPSPRANTVSINAGEDSTDFAMQVRWISRNLPSRKTSGTKRRKK